MSAGERRARSMQMVLATAGVYAALLVGTVWGQPARDAAQQPAPATPTRQPLEGSRFSRAAEAEIRFQEGLLLYNRNQLQAAERAFTDVIEADPADAEAYYYRGLARVDAQRPAEAVEDFNQSLRLDPTFDEVRAARATALIRLRRLDEAREDLEVLRPDPKWESLYHYLNGRLLLAEGKYSEAAEQFKLARAAGGTEALPAEFYEGMTYLTMREFVRARAAFRDTSGGAERDPTVAAAAQQLDAVLAAYQRGPVKPWEIQISAGAEYDTNVILLGSDVPTPADISDEADWRWVVQPRGSYSLYRKGKIDAGVEANGYFSWYNDLSDFNVQSVQGGPFVNYRLTDQLWLSGRYGFNYIEFGHDPFLARHLVTPQVTWIQPEFGYTSVYYQYQHRDFKTTPLRPELDRDGQHHAIGVVQGIRLPELFRDAGNANLELVYRYEMQDTEGSDFEGDFHTVGATIYVPMPIKRMRADAGVLFSFDRYDNPNSVDNNPAVLEPAIDSRRRDTQLSLTAGVTQGFNDNLSLRVDYTYTDRRSNIETTTGLRPYEYDRHQVGVRLIYSY